MLLIGQQKISYHDITEDMIPKMTPQEKDAYIQMGQELYENMYD